MIWRLNPSNQFENTHLNGHGDGGTATDDTADIVGGSDGRAAAVVHKGDARALNLADDTILCDANMGAMDQEAASIIGNVGRHSTKVNRNKYFDCKIVVLLYSMQYTNRYTIYTHAPKPVLPAKGKPAKPPRLKLRP